MGTSLSVLWMTEAEANKGKVITEAAAEDINALRIERALRSVFIFITLIKESIYLRGSCYLPDIDGKSCKMVLCDALK